MLITLRFVSACRLRLAAVLLFGGLALPALAADGERGISIYDKYPECMKPDELRPEERGKCVIQDGPPHRPIQAGRSKDKGNAPAPVTGMREDATGNSSAPSIRPAAIGDAAGVRGR